MGRILAIDPGTTESAYVIWDGTTIHDKGKVINIQMLDYIYDLYPVSVCDEMGTPGVCVIEQVKSYGMVVGDSIFDTVFWSGRFAESAGHVNMSFECMPRMDVKMHLCHSPRAKDANITQALIDRFAPNTSNNGKGSKKAGDFPGFFAGFKSDIWAAFALAVTYYDTRGAE